LQSFSIVYPNRAYSTGEYSYIDQNGEFVIPAKFDRTDGFSKGLALVIQDNESFFSNRKGGDTQSGWGKVTEIY
jgi:hypothetical protein